MTRPPLIDRLCSVAAASDGQDPIGYGSPIPRLLAIEVPTPWGEGFYTADPGGTLQQRLRAIQVAYFERARQLPDHPLGNPAFYGIAPDREWSTADRRRVILASRPADAFARYDLAEYSFPFESLELVDLVRAYFDSPAELTDYDSFRVDHPGYREFFVCTHGHVDACCARFGVPLYQQAREAFPQVRAWRMTHFGGHRFAPTAWEFPNGYKWAFLDRDATTQVLGQTGQPADLAAKVRGWSGVPHRVQPLDRLGLEHYGWEWLSYTRQGQVVGHDPTAQQWQVTLSFRSPAGAGGSFTGVVSVGRELPNVGCGAHWGEFDHRSAEYRLESWTLEHSNPDGSRDRAGR